MDFTYIMTLIYTYHCRNTLKSKMAANNLNIGA